MNEQKLIAKFEDEGIDAYFIAKKENIRFITGFTGDDSYAFITKDKCYFITDPRYIEQAQQECPEYEIYNWRVDGKTLGDACAALATLNNTKRIGFEGDKVNYDIYADFDNKVDAELAAASGIIEKLRSIKSPLEIQYQRMACDISCRALKRLMKEIKVGVTEKELAAKLSLYMVEEGADTMPYGNILISGARTSLLHGIPSSKPIAYGDFVLIDFGCQVNGYMSDMTRTFVVGKATPEQKEVYELEKRMVEDSLAVMKAGAKVKDVYDASIQAIKDSKYFPYHYKGIGHGIGLFVHEVPFIGPNYEETFTAGNVTTIEPGLYIPGWGGVRIEDQVLITEDGYEQMVDFTHDLIEL